MLGGRSRTRLMSGAQAHRARSSMDRASAFEAEGCRFEPCRAHHFRRSLRPKRGGMSLRPPRALAHIFARQFGVWCTHTGGTPVLREAHMTRFTKMFAAVSGAVAIGLVGVSAFLTVPASTQASTYEVAQINPDQMTRNAPRDLPSFEQKYQMHIGVVDTLRR